MWIIQRLEEAIKEFQSFGAIIILHKIWGKSAMRNLKKKTKEDKDVYNLEGEIKKVWGCEAILFVRANIFRQN